MRLIYFFTCATMIAIAFLITTACQAASRSDGADDLYKMVPHSLTTPTKPIDIQAHIGKCASYSWKNRGKASIGYIKGMNLAFARAYCDGQKVPPLGGKSEDALTAYKLAPTLKNTYALLIGLGMRESSGKWYEGRDLSAQNVTSETCEAGLFQSSYNSKSFIISSGQALPQVKDCDLATFKEGRTPQTTKNYGKGQGYQFQLDTKTCPRFAAEWASKVIRRGRSHYGPLMRMEAEFNLDCLSMLAQTEKLLTLKTCEAL